MITFTKAHQFEDLKSLKNSRRDFHGIKKMEMTICSILSQLKNSFPGQIYL